jgi:single-stranded-DNA-specific exonuclease
MVAGNLQSGRLLFIAHESYQPGVIGLVAGRLVEQYYRPSIVLSIGETHAKASARSISGFNIIEFIRTASQHLVDAGGHPMAAGFTVEIAKLTVLQEALVQKADELLTEDIFLRTIKIDCELPFAIINTELFEALRKFEPFGMGNPEPVFMSKDVQIIEKRLIGKDQTHVKLKLTQEGRIFDAIAFRMAEATAEMKIGDTVNIAYTIDENVWTGSRSLQLKVKDIH